MRGGLPPPPPPQRTCSPAELARALTARCHNNVTQSGIWSYRGRGCTSGKAQPLAKQGGDSRGRFAGQHSGSVTGQGVAGHRTL